MCTVTFLPRGKQEFILTSNRDESIVRATALPVLEYVINDKKLYFPKDQEAQGTWIASEVNGYAVCLLNGGFEKHTPNPPYRKSRGLMVLDFFSFEDPADFARNYDFKGIEPFTLVIVYSSCRLNEKRTLFELRWDEHILTLTQFDASLPHIWSSTTLYSSEIIEARKNWFREWNENHVNYVVDDILFFHHFGGTGSMENNLIMNRDSKKTVSITCFDKRNLTTDIIYEDIINKKLFRSKIINSNEDATCTR